MNYIKIRKSLGLSQPELAVLFGVPVGTIRNWEQKRRSPDGASVTLYSLVADGDVVSIRSIPVIYWLVRVACDKKYTQVNEILALKRLIEKSIEQTLSRSSLEVSILTNNSHFTPEQLGFKTTTIVR